jgi:hypothetical protein
VRVETWRSLLLRRLGWSLGAASLWTWGLLGLRMLRDGPQPLEVWFSYSLSFFMTAVYVYLGLLVYATLLAERRGDVGTGRVGDGETGRLRPPVAASPRLATMYRPVSAVGLVGLAVAVVSLAAWLLLRYPGPEAIPGTYGSVVLALMVLAVVVIGTVIARGAEDRRPTGDPR